MNSSPVSQSIRSDGTRSKKCIAAPMPEPRWSKYCPMRSSSIPADPRYKAFYRALAERKLPFLSHVGYEFSLIGKDQSLGDPDRLELALDEGATVIAAHACSYGLMLYEKFLPTFQTFAKSYPTFLRRHLRPDAAQPYAHAAAPPPPSRNS